MEFNRRDDATIRSFVMRLEQFAATNPDFRPILDQYRTPLSVYFVPGAQKAAPFQPPGGTNK